ncbi:hypothetical protein BDD12DRAFT_39205 [Trichophaea hybrida]|nr:hypothetical protein BDD12DRAFT_39205 [Trichophaea hybrida]
MATMANTLTHTHTYIAIDFATHTHQCEGFRCTSIHIQKVMDFTIHSHIFTKRWTSLHTHIYKRWTSLYTHIFTSDGFRCTLIHSEAMDFAAHTHTQAMDFARSTLIQKRWTSLHIHKHTIRWNGWRWTSPWLHR